MKRGNQRSCAVRKLLQQKWRFAREFQGISRRLSDTPGGNAGLGRLLQDACGLVWRGCDDVAPLVLAEPDGVGRTSLWRSVERDAKAAGKRHLGDRDQQSAVGDIVHGGDAASADQAADEIAGAPLGIEIDRRRRAFVSSGSQAPDRATGRDGFPRGR